MKKFEYTKKITDPSSNLLSLLGNMGVHGWEMCGCFEHQHNIVLFFKREIEDPKTEGSLWPNRIDNDG